jgi:hypothetical protein
VLWVSGLMQGTSFAKYVPGFHDLVIFCFYKSVQEFTNVVHFAVNSEITVLKPVL